MDCEFGNDKNKSFVYNESKNLTEQLENKDGASTFADQQPASACGSRTTSLGSDGDKTEKLLKILQFRNPGPQLASFDPDKSRREQRKVKQFISSNNNPSPDKHDGRRGPRRRRSREKIERRPRNPPKRRNYHDRSGIRLSDNKDVCDCQHIDCPGCHFPCDACGSEKCGVECRCSRKWTYQIDVEIENPLALRLLQVLQ